MTVTDVIVGGGGGGGGGGALLPPHPGSERITKAAKNERRERAPAAGRSNTRGARLARKGRPDQTTRLKESSEVRCEITGEKEPAGCFLRPRGSIVKRSKTNKWNSHAKNSGRVFPCAGIDKLHGARSREQSRDARKTPSGCPSPPAAGQGGSAGAKRRRAAALQTNQSEWRNSQAATKKPSVSWKTSFTPPRVRHQESGSKSVSWALMMRKS